MTRTLATGVALLALAVAGCGSDDDGGGSGASGGGGSDEAKLAFVYPTTTTNFAQEMALGAKAAADDTPGVDLTESAPANVDGPKQVQLFQAAVRTSKDGVAMMTLTPELFIRPLQQAGDQGVPLVAVDVPPPAGTEEDVKLLIGNSNVEIGQDLAKALLEDIPEDATGDDDDRHRHAGPAGARAAQRGLHGGHEGRAAGAEVHRVRRQAEPDRQLQHLERAGQGAPGRGRVRRPGQPGRGVAVADPEAQRRQKLLVGACDLDKVAHAGRQGRARQGAHLARALAQGLPRDQADGRRQARGQAAARGRVELRRAGRSTPTTSTRSSRARRARRPASEYFKDEVDKQLVEPRRAT